MSTEPTDTPGQAGPAAPAARKSPYLQARFLAAAAVLLVCAVGFNAAAQALKFHFRKQAVPLAVKALDDKAEGLPAKIGNRWLQVTEDQPLSADVEHTLATKQYVFRTYVDLRAARKTEEDLKGRDPRKIAELLADLQARSPEAVIRVGITYYTGLVDTVAHIPERCMVADGYEPAKSPEPRPGPADYADGKPRDAKYRFITFEDVTGRQRVTRNVGYLFHVNGRYEDDPLGVRGTLQTLTETHGYYAKVELMTEQRGRGDAGADEKAASAMEEFLAAALPELERMLPDWQAVTGRAAAKN